MYMCVYVQIEPRHKLSFSTVLLLIVPDTGYLAEPGAVDSAISVNLPVSTTPAWDALGSYCSDKAT